MSELGLSALRIVRDAVTELRRLAGTESATAAVRSLLDSDPSSEPSERRERSIAAELLMVASRGDGRGVVTAFDLYRKGVLAIREGDIPVARRFVAALEEEVVGNTDVDKSHWLHILRGMVALAEQQPAGAVVELRAAGRVGSSPVLRSFGPDLSLAWSLLAVDPDAALSYFKDVAVYWSPA